VLLVKERGFGGYVEKYQDGAMIKMTEEKDKSWLYRSIERDFGESSTIGIAWLAEFMLMIIGLAFVLAAFATPQCCGATKVHPAITVTFGWILLSAGCYVLHTLHLVHCDFTKLTEREVTGVVKTEDGIEIPIKGTVEMKDTKPLRIYYVEIDNKESEKVK